MDLALQIIMQMNYVNIIQYALGIYNDKNQWDRIVKQAMNSDNSWRKIS